MTNRSFEVSDEVFTPRPYQLEILEKAKKRNVIVQLPTGSGKTYIGILMIKEVQYTVRKSISEGGKRIFFVVNNVCLVEQQARHIKNECELVVGELHGESSITVHDTDKIKTFLEQHQVIVLTAQILLDLICFSRISMEDISLLIFDECHHSMGKAHPYSNILSRYDKVPNEKKPVILGLTASLFNQRLKKNQIENLLLKLEYKMHAEVVTADDFSQVLKYSAIPNIKLIECSDFNAEKFDIAQKTLSFVDKLNELVREMEKLLKDSRDFDPSQFIKTDINSTIANSIYEKFIDTSSKDIRKKISEFVYITNNLGPFTVYKICDFWTGDLKNYKNDQTISVKANYVVEAAFDVFDSIKKEYTKKFSTMVTFEEIEPYLSNKLKKVIEILETFNKKCIEDPSVFQSMSCIIFVERRSAAYAIFEVLKELKKLDKARFGFIKADYIVGYNNNKSVEETTISSKIQDKKLQSFRQGSLNVLVSTDVLEEGFDVRQCNLVIRYKFPKNFRSYVQGRGRVRHKQGLYILLSDSKSLEDDKAELKNFEECETLLIQRFRTPNNFVDNKKSINCPDFYVDSLYDSYVVESTGATAVLSNAITIINRYCQKLPCDNFTVLSPSPDIIENEDGTYECSLLLPANCPYRNIIRSKKPLPSAKLSKMAAAVEACKILHQIKELNDNLLPNGREKLKLIETKFDDYEDEVDIKEVIVGSAQRKQLYDKKSSIYLYDILPLENEESYLYIFDIDLKQPIHSYMNLKNRKIDNPQDYECAFGFLSKKVIPDMPSFPIFLRYGCAEVTVKKHPKKYLISLENWDKAIKFHEYIFSDILRVTDVATFSAAQAIVKIVTLPLKKIKLESDNEFDYEIDFNYMDYILETLEGMFKPPLEEDRKKYVFNESLYENAIVYPWYRSEENRNYYIIGEIMHDVKPSSDFPDNNFKTFEEYFLEKYKITIYNKDQPLLDVDYTSNRLNLLVPKYPSKSSRPLKNSRSSQRQILVPELVSIHPIKSTHWSIIGALPSIFYRYNCLLMANELRETIVKNALGKTNVYRGPFEPLSYKTCLEKDLKDEKNLNEIIEEETDQVEEDITDFEIGVWDPQYIDTFDILKPVKEIPDQLNNDVQCLKASYPDDEKMESDIDDIDEEKMGTFKFLSVDERPEIKPVTESSFTLQKLESLSGWDDPCIDNQEIKSVLHISDVDASIDKKALVRDMNDVNELEETEYLDEKFSTYPIKKKHLVDIEKKFVDLREYEQSESPPPITKDDFNIHMKLDEFEDLGQNWKTIVRDNYELLIEQPVMPYKLDDEGIDTDDLYSKGVNPAILLCALTSRGANDGIDLERLETIGDSFLKFATTDYLYHKHVNAHEGCLSLLRSKEVSNMKLYFLGKKRNIHNIIINDKFEPHTNWIPPGYVVSSEFKPNYVQQNADKEDKDAEAILNCDFESDDKLSELCSEMEEGKNLKKSNSEFKFKKVRQFNELSNIVYNPYLQQQICDKTIADVVEALIGCHLIHIGFDGTLKFMQWMGISVFSHHYEAVEIDPMIKILDFPQNPNKSMQCLYGFYKKNLFDIFEQKIGYIFKNKAYLIQAFSHASYYINRVTSCYQRLEFLGDAVLDFVITRYLFSHEASFNPGTLTDLRSALVNNTMLASVAVDHDFHKYLMEFSPKLHEVVRKFVTFIKSHENELINLDSDLFMVNEDEEDCDGTEDVEVPKALGDIFESFVGAVYLDSGRNLNVVWALIYKMMKPHLERYTKEPPISPIRELTESYPDKVQFSKVERDPNTQRVKVYVEVSGTKITGGGRNFKIAKCNAAKRALKYIKQLEKERAKNQNIL
ncbi:Endoribonuclease Dicer [Strongyloides ratti]|uniref:Endoribonuclease Dicer n=1 Tax=Strongyloides ratti TaxID=34506 RepID=A0A090LA41_STRRB|nr:Endoribonuclease Dicer [Strongyloides ratti]CEF64380.1 Endoribonuclease Dicer [Strongyloides ratti]